MRRSGSARRYANGLCLIACAMIGAVVYFDNDAAAAPRAGAAAIYTEKGCVACHDLNARKLGPSLKAIAKRYSIKDKAKLADRVLNGSAGAWGNVPMPATKGMGVTRADADSLAIWILNQK